ncbi:glycosyltransferase [Algoriphagus lacus]|uniref:Glycosyltransferase n=1 Tax=Algoriphagus lacus TaxID=2056311 RepID=A0A418PLJ5_9BACT|nr:glycosyltransferase [Algoriphagus lacus]RIW11691.1 glycosyltransferase [Algoriphagus lacus]
MVNGIRKRIGIIFNFSHSWLGGVYYIQNIIKGLNLLEDEIKPTIVIFHNEDLSGFAKEINYTYLELVSWNFISIYKGYFLSWLFQKNLFIQDILDNFQLDGIYPLYDQPVSVKNKQIKIVAWFPDLQHKFYPKYFGFINLVFREIRLKLMLKNSNVLVVSSNDVASHFKKFYKIPSSCRIHVFPFISFVDGVNFENIDDLLVKYKLPKKYFIVSNQFYEHKNHIVVFKALSILKEKNIKTHIVFTGKMDDYRNPLFIKELENKIIDFGISEYVSLLGMIPRSDQLCLLKHSQAVIQPSLFEGWSTVIEDANFQKNIR